ncbi:hypothetical protein ACN4EG_19840 [Alkalinema pantanalense CENA528]|uniref:hypothetical protein n=1 Tax=Alkalinema pantanalense TaxID=1620705 RepID=UPI003D6EBEC3
MTLPEALQNARYLTNASGLPTDVVLPIEAWHEVLALLQQLDQIQDAAWQQQAENALKNSSTVGVEAFTQEIARLAALDSASDS